MKAVRINKLDCFWTSTKYVGLSIFTKIVKRHVELEILLKIQKMLDNKIF